MIFICQFSDEKDDDEQVILSVMNLNINQNDAETEHEPKEANVSYASKGPMVQKRSRATANANAVPYRKNNPQVDNRKTANLMKERVELNRINNIDEDLGLDVDGLKEEHCTLGSFVDVSSFLPELVLSSGNESTQTATKDGSTPTGKNVKTGIPSLPDTSPTLNGASLTIFPRIVAYKKPKVLWMPMPQVKYIIPANVKCLLPFNTHLCQKSLDLTHFFNFRLRS